MKAYRHGDVIIKQVTAIPQQAQEQKEKIPVLALGEVTGHSHRVEGGFAKSFKFDDRVYLRVRGGLGLLRHEEHKEIKLPEGDYEVVIQEDYEPDGWKKVTD